MLLIVVLIPSSPNLIFDTHFQIEEGDAYQALLLEISGQKTVPNVFINGNHIGGCDDTLKLDAEGKLVELVKDVTN